MEGGAVGHNFERDHPYQVCLIWFSSFRGEDLNVIFYQNMPNLHNWYKSAERIVPDSPALHSIWLLLLKIEISSIVHYCFSLNQNELKF
jgi:hypothetical protein